MDEAGQGIVLSSPPKCGVSVVRVGLIDGSGFPRSTEGSFQTPFLEPSRPRLLWQSGCRSFFVSSHPKIPAVCAALPVPTHPLNLRSHTPHSGRDRLAS